MKGMRGGGRKKIEGALPPQQLHGDEEENDVTVCDSRMEVVGAERVTREVDDASNVDDNDDDDDDDDEMVGEEEDKERPKLDEGFYEIEDVRRKRVRKGQIQYLIKWRGWPENANTWEPLENLQSCSDVIESFEDRSGNHKCYQKRKRKQGVPHTQAKKKQHPTSTLSLSCVKVGSGFQNFASASLDSSSLSKSSPLESSECKGDDHLNKAANCLSNGVLGEHLPENVSGNVLLEDDQNKKVVLTRSYAEGALAKKLNAGRILSHVSNAMVLDRDGPNEEVQKTECLNLAQTSRCTGARKRKLGSVRRLKQESTSNELGDTQNSIARSVIESGDKFGVLGMKDAYSLEDVLGDMNNLDDSISPSSLTKIIKAIGSDGREVVVDSKYLKANNPLLDIGVVWKLLYPVARQIVDHEMPMPVVESLD
ncbi:hypothetical protein Sjap_008700 [Stephania japonica]|uniref:Chromo domain-containing protein n=1 Tax=Stephania japonica TaxID=461633 RepID=A0AAP0JQR2_9MAGN